MARWHSDDTDVACETWARQWVDNFARDPDRASRFVGPLGCTLGRVRELHDGASSSTERDRHFPEVYLGQGLLVRFALEAMTESSRIIVWSHYVMRCYNLDTLALLKRPTKQIVVAERLGISLRDYYRRRDVAKHCIATALSVVSAHSKAVASDGGEMARCA